MTILRKNNLFGILLFGIVTLSVISILKLSEKPVPSDTGIKTTPALPAVSVFANSLDTPWAIAFLGQDGLLVTERPGRVQFIDAKGLKEEVPVSTSAKIKEIGEGGLLGLVLHPEFLSNHYVYLYYTYEANKQILNRVVKMTYQDKKLTHEKIVVDRIPGSPNHNGGRIKFGPDNFLYITTGDAQKESLAQDKNSLAGKILRVTDEGKPAPGNPFGNLVYSFGHRNPQGLAWDTQNRLWSTEHGRSGALSGLDELNLIEAGKNYGWPVIQGDEQKPGMETPFLNSGAETWAPGGASFIGNALFFGGLRGQTLYEAGLIQGKTSLTKHFEGKWGRIREVTAGPDGMLYFTTSNHDGRGTPKADDDKIIRMSPDSF